VVFLGWHIRQKAKRKADIQHDDAHPSDDRHRCGLRVVQGCHHRHQILRSQTPIAAKTRVNICTLSFRPLRAGQTRAYLIRKAIGLTESLDLFSFVGYLSTL
jgi:hypothetical protein